MNESGSNAPVVLITGAAGGLGRAFVEAFAAAGWRVAAACRSLPADHVSSDSNSIWWCTLDVTRPDEITERVSELQSRWGQIDLLINNAGISEDEVLPRMTEESWQRVMDVNLRGAFLCARAVLPKMVERREGQILNIASFGGRVGRAGTANYSASKAGLLGLTVALAREHGRDNIRVNALLPGFLRTKLVGSLSEADLAAHAASNTLNRLNSTDEVASFATQLATLRNVSGQIFQLDSRIGPW